MSYFDPRQPTKGSLIELGLEYLSSLLDKSSCVQKLNSKAKEHKLVKKKQDTKGLTIKLSNELRYKGKAHIMTTHRG